MIDPAKVTLGFLEQARYGYPGADIVIERPYCFIRRIVVDDIVLDSGAERFMYQGRPLREAADVFAPYFVVDAAPIDCFTMTVARAMEIEGCPVINSFDTYQRFGDKFLTLCTAQRLGLQVARTSLFYPSHGSLPDAITRIEAAFPYPFIIKPRGLLKGIAVFRIENRDQLISTLQMYERAGMLPLVQEFIGPGGEDHRLFFAGGEYLYAYKRVNPESFISNSTRLGYQSTLSAATKVRIEAPATLIERSRRIVEAVPMDYVAIDWLEHGDDYLLHEVEPMPGLTFMEEEDRLLLERRIAGIAMSRLRAAPARS